MNCLKNSTRECICKSDNMRRLFLKRFVGRCRKSASLAVLPDLYHISYMIEFLDREFWNFSYAPDIIKFQFRLNVYEAYCL